MNMTRLSVVFIAAFLTIGVPACSDERSFDQTAGGRTFRIPKSNSFKETISYLPVSQNRGLRFVLNPEASKDRRILISMDPESNCPQPEGRLRSDSRCNAIVMPFSELQLATITRVASSTGKAWWEYRTKGSGATVASCSEIENGADGLCMHYGIYKDLAYVIHLRDSQISNLSEIRRSVDQKLSDWEI